MQSLSGGNALKGVPAFLERTAARYGPVASWRVPHARIYLIDEPAAIEDLLVRNAGAFVKARGSERLRPLLGNGLLTANGPAHLRQRRLEQPAFARERMAGYARTMIAETAADAAAFVSGSVVAVDEAMHGLTLRIAARTLFSADVTSDADAVGRAVDDAMTTFPFMLTVLGEFADYLPFVPAVRRFRRARAKLDAVVRAIVAARRAAGDDDRGDLLSVLLAARDEDGRGLDDVQIRDEVMTLFLAGHETTANALAWTLDLLARTPDAETALFAELDAVLDGRDPEPGDVERLPYARAVVSESLRLYPPAWAIGRRAVADTTVGGWPIAAGSVVLASPWVTHRSPRSWPEPLAFRPDRWLRDGGPAVPRFAYFPFGGGNRICIGERFAWTEAILVLATLLARRRFALVDPTPVPTNASVTLRPGASIRLRVEARRTKRLEPLISEAGSGTLPQS
jgi:cytochrome P450